MPAVRQSFRAPYSSEVLDRDGRFFSNPWEWFIRRVEQRLHPLGVEEIQQLVNNMQALSFATTDVNTSTEKITETAHPYYTGLKGQFSTTGTLPLGLSLATDYFIIDSGTNDYQAAASYSDAIAGTATGLASQGSGTHTFTPYADIVGAKFDKNGITCAFFEYLCQRITTGGSAVELTEVGFLIFVYNPTSETWSKVTVSEANPDDAGLTISILANGQVYYDTTSIAGTASISSLFWRARTFAGKNISYSKVNR